MKRFASDRVTGLMERMGLQGDVALEHGLVSRTIESAQTRVEGYNFDIRKRVVEYDDVINKQRETIYAERDKVLNNEDLTDTVRSFVDAEIETLVDSHMAGGSEHDWDVDGLAREIQQIGLEGDDLDADALAEIGVREDLIEHLKAAVDHTLEQREQQLGPEVWAQVERLILLRTIDTLWVDHLTELDDMRRGIGLRGYGGIDPLNEFKREAFKLYEELRGFISRQVANTIFRVQVTTTPQPQTQPETTTEAAPVRATATATTSGDGAATAAGAGAAPVLAGAAAKGLAAAVARRGGLQFQHGEQVAAAGAARGAKPSSTEGPKLGRNDPCWCGSGKKFKRCHGA
jgi:preprotein translocase subunit SecA